MSKKEMEVMVKEVLKKESSKSSKMLEMYEMGMSISDISKIMNVRYNFVYNVVSNKCRIEGVKVRVSKSKGEVKSKVIELIDKGLNNSEISSELKMNYNYVWKIRKEYEISK